MTVAELWAELENDLPSINVGDWVARRVTPQGRFDLRLGISGTTRQRCLLIRVENSAVPSTIEYPEARGFELNEAWLADTPRTHTTLAVSLVDRKFADIFTTLVSDVIERIDRAGTEKQAILELINRLKVWQRFMEKAGTDGLSKKSQRGLYGELTFLRDFLIPANEALLSINAWVGPNGAPQDFQWLQVACEVKTTITKQHQKIEIASELQLDTRAMDILWLYHLSLDERSGSGESLVDAINGVAGLIESNPIASDLFADRLLEAGYLPDHSEQYRNPGYSVREAKFFAVEDGFPRITERDLPNGVGDVRYSIAVTECEHFVTSEKQVRDRIGEST